VMCRKQTNEMNIWFNVGCSFGVRSSLSLISIGEWPLSRSMCNPNPNPVQYVSLSSDAYCDSYERQLNYLNNFLITGP
jgi:hypothetical protein